MANKKSYFLFISFLFLILAYAESAYSQSTKSVSKTGSGHEDLIIQKGDQQSAGLRQDGERQRSFIFQTGFGQSADVWQSGISNLVFIHQMLNNVEGESTQTARLTQSGFYNIMFVGQSELNRASFLQKGSGNTIFYRQESDSAKTRPSEINIKQTGNGNRATIIQN